MLYAGWVNAVAAYLPETVVSTTSEQPFQSGSRYNQVVDRAIEYAELRMYRDADLDLLSARASLTTTATAGTRGIALPAGMVVAEEANVITPAGDVPGAAGSSRNQLVPVSMQFMNRVWPSVTYQAQPQHIARIDDDNMVLGPVPDQGYVVEFYGTIRPTQLSAANTATILTQNFPDLFLAASMIWWSMFQKNLGAVQSVGPLEGVTWEEQYQSLKKGAAVEEARKKFQSAGWTATTPTTVATPPRQ
jgi:hypothetical protein